MIAVVEKDQISEVADPPKPCVSLHSTFLLLLPIAAMKSPFFSPASEKGWESPATRITRDRYQSSQEPRFRPAKRKHHASCGEAGEYRVAGPLTNDVRWVFYSLSW